jgi:DNA-binding GntR family transcriptional regulator
MKVRKVRRGKAGESATLARQVYDGLCHEITTGNLKPGMVLSRRKIAASYGTSYVSVIEAMVRLENTGLIEVESAQMARVRKVTQEFIEHTYVLREALEVQAIYLACASATAGEIQDLYRLAETLDAHISAWDSSRGKTADTEGPVLHWEFHRRIAELSRCPVLVQELERIELLRRLQANWVYVPDRQDPARWHSQLVDALQTHDPQAAVAAMRAHVRSGREKELQGYRMGTAKRTS